MLNWVNPGKPSDFGTAYVYASPNGNFSSAVKIGETDGTQFTHDASTAADAVAPGDVRYYWVRAIKNVGTDAAARSNLEPNADPNTTVFATVGRVNWADVDGSADAPASNATVGAQISVNLYDADGSSVMSAADVKNSVLAQEILEVEIENGQVLNLETGAAVVDIQNLGDVAIYVSDSNQTLNTSINTVAQNLSALEDTIVDLTSGVADIYIGTAFPVPGQSGIPNPIPTFSRFYKSDDGNHPYYWTGSAWTSLKDAEIAQNSASITNLTSNLATTNTNVTANSSAISALDTLTIAQGGSITSLSGSVTALQSTVNNATTGVVANAGAVSSLTTRVTNTENATTVNAGNITTLTADLDQAELDIATKASSTAVSGLTVRVTAAEGSIVTNTADITALQSVVTNPSAGILANANAITALTTRVEDNEDGVLVNAGAVTTLNATYTEDLHFRTEAEDENDNLIDLETGSGTVQLQDLTDFVSGSSAAIDSLTVQTFANEDGIQTQAIQLTALESTVNDPTNGVTATAGALSTLSTTVSVIDNQVSTTAQDLTALTTTVGGNTATITTQSNSINGVEANYSVKIDNNNRITGFGLLSTTAGSTPFSEFAVVADQFSIVSPNSTADTPIQPFTVTADKIYFGADVIVSGDLISTGTISADRLQIDNVMFDTETVGNVTSLVIKASGVDTSQIAESAITTARLSNDAVTVDKFANTLQSTNYVADTAGWQILTSGNVEFQNAKVNGDIVAQTLTVTEANITGTLTLGGGVLQDGSGNNLTTTTTLNAQQVMSEVTGVISQAQHIIPSFWRITTNDSAAPSNSEFNTAAGRLAKVNDIVITTDTTTTPDTTYGWTCTVAGTGSAEATWAAITNFMSGDLLVDGTITADQIAANAVTAAKISVSDLSAINASVGAITGGTLKGGTVPDANAAPSGTESGSFFDLTGGKFVVGNATNNFLFNGSTLAVSGAITATSLALSEGITIGKSVVGLTNVDDVSQATIQSDTLTAATSSDVGLGSVENLDAQAQAQTGLIAQTTITDGGIVMSGGGAVKTLNKDSESDTTNGFFLGYNATTSKYTFGVGDANQSMQWNGSDLSVTGAITATSLNVTNATITGSISANNIKIDNVTLDTDGAGNLIIATDGVNTGQIKPGAVTPTEMTVTSLAAITADLGTVTAGSLDAGIITGDVNESNVIQNATSLAFSGPSGEVTILEGSVAASTGDGHKIFSVCSGYFASTSSKVYWIRMYLRDTPTSSYVLTSTTKVKATTGIATPFTIAGGTTAVKTGEVGVKITIRRYGSNGTTPDGSTALDYVRERTCFIEGVR